MAIAAEAIILASSLLNAATPDWIKVGGGAVLGLVLGHAFKLLLDIDQFFLAALDKDRRHGAVLLRAYRHYLKNSDTTDLRKVIDDILEERALPPCFLIVLLQLRDDIDAQQADLRWPDWVTPDLIAITGHSSDAAYANKSHSHQPKEQ